MSVVGTTSLSHPAASALTLRAAASPAAPQSPDSVALGESSSQGLGSVLGRGAALVGGGAAGLVAGNLAATATQTVGGLATQFVLASLPPLQVAPALAQLLNTGLALGFGGGALAAAGTGLATGAAIAYFAAKGEQKVDDAMWTADVEKRGLGSGLVRDWRDSGAELGHRVRSVHNAESLRSAVSSGYEAGSTLGGHVGAKAGKVQGALMGAAVGTVASLPLVAAVNSLVALPLPAMAVVALPVALVGFGLGGKLGESVGQVVGGVAGGIVGGAGGAAYHGVHSLVGRD